MLNLLSRPDFLDAFLLFKHVLQTKNNYVKVQLVFFKIGSINIELATTKFDKICRIVPGGGKFGIGLEEQTA